MANLNKREIYTKYTIKMYIVHAYNTTLIESNNKICTTCFINRDEKNNKNIQLSYFGSNY